MAALMAQRSPLVAVDTNILLDLAVPKDKSHAAIEIFRQRVASVEFVVLPTVIDELDYVRGVDMTHLGLARKSCDVGVVLVRTPAEIVRQFGGKH